MKAMKPSPRSRLFVLTTALCTVVLLVALPRPAAACSCLPPPPPAEELAASDAVFSGTVLEVERTFRDTEFGKVPQQRVVIQLDRVWKAPAVADSEAGSDVARALAEGEQVELTTGSGGGDCGYGFESDTAYLVYATITEDGALTTGICTRTQPLDGSDEDVAALGEVQRKLPHVGGGERGR